MVDGQRIHRKAPPELGRQLRVEVRQGLSIHDRFDPRAGPNPPAPGLLPVGQRLAVGEGLEIGETGRDEVAEPPGKLEGVAAGGRLGRKPVDQAQRHVDGVAGLPVPVQVRDQQPAAGPKQAESLPRRRRAVEPVPAGGGRDDIEAARGQPAVLGHAQAIVDLQARGLAGRTSLRQQGLGGVQTGDPGTGRGEGAGQKPGSGPEIEDRLAWASDAEAREAVEEAGGKALAEGRVGGGRLAEISHRSSVKHWSAKNTERLWSP